MHLSQDGTFFLIRLNMVTVLALALSLLLGATAILDSSHPVFSSPDSIRRRYANALDYSLFESFKAPAGQWSNATRFLDMEKMFFDADGTESHMSAFRVFTALDPLRTLSGSAELNRQELLSKSHS